MFAHLANLPRAALRTSGWCLWLLALAAAESASAADARPETFRDNVVIVLDASGSMSGRMAGGGPTKMAAAKTALKSVLQRLAPNTQVGFLVFSGANIPSEWVYPLGPRDDARLLRAIDMPQPSGGTPLGAYIKIGADRLLQERERQFGYGTFRLLIVTDGEAQDQALVERYTPEVVARGITVDVIGVAMDQRHTLATRVHSYRAANDARALERALTEVFAEVRSQAQDSTSAEIFAVLEPIPDQVAMAAIQALATSGNYPIGESPASSASPVDSGAAAVGSPAGSGPSGPPGAPPSRTSGSQPQSGSSVFKVLGSIVCCGLVMLALLGSLVKAAKRSRGRR